MKSALYYYSDNADFWNSLGVLSYRTDPQLGQHAFIRALEIDPQAPMIWSNLGFFYLVHEDIELASQSFKKAQFVDPEWAMGWLGQTLVAKITASDDLFQMVEHTYNLGKSLQVFLFDIDRIVIIICH